MSDVGGCRLGKSGVMPACSHFRMSLLLKYPPVRKHLQLILICGFLGSFGHGDEMLAIVTLIDDFVCHDQVVLTVNHRLNVVAYDSSPAATGRHRTRVWIGQ